MSIVKINAKKHLAILRLSASQSGIATVTDTKLNLNNIALDTNSLCDTANGKIVIKKSGFYTVLAHIYAGANVVVPILFANVRKNGTQIFSGTTYGGGSSTIYSNCLVTSPPLMLNAGDYLELYLYHTYASALTAYGTTANLDACFLSVSEL